MRTCVAIVVSIIVVSPIALDAQGGSATIRVPSPSASRCINSNTDEVTITLRRVLTQKTSGFFTSQNKAGVAVLATVNSSGTPPAKTPSVNEIDIQDVQPGQVSLALEYPIADQLVLKQGSTVTQNIQLDLYMAKTSGSNTFGSVLDIAGQVLQKLPIPANPFTASANQFLQFANQSIQNAVTSSGNAVLFASVNLAFADHDEADVTTCAQDSYQSTGAIGVIRSTGASGQTLLPVVNLDQNFCFRYSSAATYELQYVQKPAAGCSSAPTTGWKEVANDYVMLLIAASKTAATAADVHTLMMVGEGIGGGGGGRAGGRGGGGGGRGSATPSTRLDDLIESRKLCQAMQLSPHYCGVH
jgi:uncharacterized membrane protein YgcG